MKTIGFRGLAYFQTHPCRVISPEKVEDPQEPHGFSHEITSGWGQAGAVSSWRHLKIDKMKPVYIISFTGNHWLSK